MWRGHADESIEDLAPEPDLRSRQSKNRDLTSWPLAQIWTTQCFEKSGVRISGVVSELRLEKNDALRLASPLASKDEKLRGELIEARRQSRSTCNQSGLQQLELHGDLKDEMAEA